jgi:uncharacterized membrane protein YphA (DoxX/SURF4 family)
MTLLRAAARTMLASYFVASGVKALRNPGPLVPLAEPLADRVVPLLKQYAPDQIARYVPEDAKTLVRVNGATQVIGGLALATGKGRRLGAVLLAGSLVPSTIAKHPFWSRSDPDEKALDRSQFVKNVSLLGGVLLASADTEGKPSLVWRAQKGGEHLAKDTRKAAKKLTSSSSGIGDTAGDLADSALAGGAALVGAVVASSRKARKEATKQFKQAQVVAAKQAKQARKDAPKLAKAAAKQASEFKALAAKRAEEAQAAAAKAAKQAKKDAPKQLKAAQEQAAKQAKSIKKAAKKSKHISLGEN